MTTDKLLPRCEKMMWTDIWHPKACGKPAKFRCTNPANDVVTVTLCGIHVREKRSRGWKIEELSK